ncbi:hypothetical protein HF282_03205, partial [Acidithiobacillus ferrooxidans]|nr:hypothetical protein [Acidithiobacillus ferrooxidans]
MQRTHLIHFSHDSSFSIRLRQDHTRAHMVASHAKAVIMRIFSADLQQCFDRVGVGSCRYPVFHLQSFHPSELSFIVGNYDPAFGAGVCGDPQIIIANGPP